MQRALPVRPRVPARAVEVRTHRDVLGPQPVRERHRLRAEELLQAVRRRVRRVERARLARCPSDRYTGVPRSRPARSYGLCAAQTSGVARRGRPTAPPGRRPCRGRGSPRAPRRPGSRSGCARRRCRTPRPGTCRDGARRRSARRSRPSTGRRPRARGPTGTRARRSRRSSVRWKVSQAGPVEPVRVEPGRPGLRHHDEHVRVRGQLPRRRCCSSTSGNRCRRRSSRAAGTASATRGAGSVASRAGAAAGRRRRGRWRRSGRSAPAAGR